MEIRDLEIFLCAAKHLNFTRAGEELHLSQPSVSVRIRQLESDLGVKLFEQLGKKIALTEAGRLLVPYALRVLAAADDARHAVEELQGLARGSLKVGASTTPGMYVLPKVIAEFKSLYPGVEVHLRVKDTRQVEEGVIRNEFDFGFVGGHLVGDEVKVIPWLTDELLLIVPPRHPLAKKRQVRAKDLTRERFILREQGSATQAAVDSSLRASGVQPEPVIEMENPESVKRAVQSGLGVAFVSRFAVETELKARALAAVTVRDLKIRREMKIVHRVGKHLSKAALAFIETARKAG